MQLQPGIDTADPRPLLVLYGSQTGCAEEVANSLARDAVRRHFDVELSSLDDLVLVSCTSTRRGR